MLPLTPAYNGSVTLVVSTTRERGCSSRLKIHRSEAEDSLLASYLDGLVPTHPLIRYYVRYTCAAR